MTSISHWGMFPTVNVRFFVPKGFKVSDHDIAEWSKPSGVIMMERVEPPSRWWPFS